MESWVNWREFLDFIFTDKTRLSEFPELKNIPNNMDFETFHQVLCVLYQNYTFEMAAAEAQVDPKQIKQAAEWIADCGGKLAAHTWRAASIGTLFSQCFNWKRRC
jgi:hypothetical protein